MTYSYTQISQYLTCPRRYRHRYLDGWQEKDTRAAMLFGRVFEQDGRLLLPLPHASGVSRWLNAPANRRLVDQALAQLAKLREELQL